MDFKISSNINESHIFFYGRCDWRLSKKSQKNFAKILNQTLSSNSPNMHIVLNFSQVEVVDYVFCAFLCELLRVEILH